MDKVFEIESKACLAGEYINDTALRLILEATSLYLTTGQIFSVYAYHNNRKMVATKYSSINQVVRDCMFDWEKEPKDGEPCDNS